MVNSEILTPRPETDKNKLPLFQDEPVEINPLFDYLLHPPEGIGDIEAFVYEKYVGEKIVQNFAEHGMPNPAEYFAVTRTLRAVYGSEYRFEKRRWEKLRGIKHSQTESSSK